MPTSNDPNGNAQKVDSNGHAFVAGFVHDNFYHSSTEDGLAYIWRSGELDIDATDTMLFVKNTGDKDLIIDRIILNGGNVICNWEVAIGNATTTPTGTVVTPINWNRNNSTQLPSYVSYSDETAVAQGDVLFNYWTAVTTSHPITVDGLVLGQNHYIQIDQVTESTAGGATIIGHIQD